MFHFVMIRSILFGASGSVMAGQIWRGDDGFSRHLIRSQKQSTAERFPVAHSVKNLGKRWQLRCLKTHRCFPRWRSSSICGRSCCPAADCRDRGSLSSVESPCLGADFGFFATSKGAFCVSLCPFVKLACWLTVHKQTARRAPDASQLNSPRGWFGFRGGANGIRDMLL